MNVQLLTNALAGLQPTHLVFLVIAAVTIIGAIGVVSARSVFASALFLILSFVGVSGIYILLGAGFLAAVQIIIYVGAISVLILFAVMLTRNMGTETRSQFNRQAGISLGLCLLLAVFLSLAAGGIEWPISTDQLPANQVIALGQQLLSAQFVVPFEVASIFLLTALIGALFIARE
ncbi:MAG: NADH-quinone oxidoreductase subunit J [Chloroflexi bacterium]|nr:NADH-quinone oxidoreductase subunit J [Chloroflexota bacterium]